MRRLPLPALLVLLALASLLPASGGGDERRALGDALRRAEALAAGEDPRAETAFRHALDAAEAYGGLLLARAVDGLAGTCARDGRTGEAIELYRRAIPMWRELLGPRQPRLAVSLHNLGVLLLKHGEPVAARDPLTESLEIREAVLGAASPEAAATRRALARARAAGT